MTKETARYALITGASQGLGRAFAEECAGRGMDLVLVALPETGLPEVARILGRAWQVSVEAIEMDLTSREAPRAIAAACRSRGFYELARRVRSRPGPDAYAVDPGLVKTRIAAKENSRIVRAIWSIRTRKAISPREAAESVAWCAADPSAGGKTGMYWKERRPLDSSPESYDPEAGRRLWELGERLSGVRYP